MSLDPSKGRPHQVDEIEEVVDNTSAGHSADVDGEQEEPKVEVYSSEERALVRKLDRRILPITCILYLFAYLDRTNLGNARLQGLPADVLHGDPTGVLFNWVNSAFFFSYILCQIPATILSKLFPPRVWIAFAVLGWGLCSTLMATGFNFAGLMVARIGLGVFEACFGPGIPLYYSLFYTKEEMGLRLGYWFGFAAVAGAFGGLIAYGIQHAHVAIANWRLLFIVEGVPTIALSVLTLMLLPNRPESTTFLNEKERALAVARMNRGTKGDIGAVINKAHIWKAFRDWTIYVGGAIYFSANCALASISAFLPTIIKTFGYSNANAQLLTVPPYAVATLVLCLFAFGSDRMLTRGPFIVVSSIISGIGYIILLTAHENVHARYFATFCITSGTYAIIGLIIAWYSHNLGSETKKATGFPMYMAIGQCGSILGSHIFPSTEGPRYIRGFAVSCGLMFLAAILAVVLTVYYHAENARRDRIYGKPNPDAPVDTSELADKAPAFRYLP